MKHYLCISATTLILSAASLSVMVYPYAGVPYCIGSVLAILFTVAIVAANYNIDTNPNKDERWRHVYFTKNYPRECMLQGIFLMVPLLLSFAFWRPFFMFLCGYTTITLLFSLTEWGWAMFVNRSGKLD